MKLGTKLGLTGCAAGFAMATYFIVNPAIPSLASEAQLNGGIFGVFLGLGFCMVGTLFGLISARKRKSNA